jgi:hypothetical protein
LHIKIEDDLTMTFSKLGITKRGFWDIDTESLDINVYYRTVIEKVINYGTWDDVVKIISYYSFEKFLSVGRTSPNIQSYSN